MLILCHSQVSGLVEDGLKGKKQKTSDVRKAVGNYLQLTKTTSQSIATKLDEQIQAIVKQAQDLHNGTTNKKFLAKVQQLNLNNAIVRLRRHCVAILRY